MSESRVTNDVPGNGKPSETGSVLEFPVSGHTGSAGARRPAAWGLSTRLTEGEAAGGRKAIVQIGELTTVCVVADVPVVGDLIHGNTAAVVESVRITRDGIVRVLARPTERPDVAEPNSVDAGGVSARVAGMLAEIRRHRLLGDNLPGRSPDLLEGA